MYLRQKSVFEKSIGKFCTEKYVWLKTENTQESFLSDMIRNRFPESSLLLSISSHSPLLSLTESFCSGIILSVTLVSA